MKIEFMLIKRFINRYVIAYATLMTLILVVGYIGSILPEDSSGENILYGVLIFLNILAPIMISVLGILTLFLDKPEYYILRYQSRFKLFMTKSAIGLILFSSTIAIYFVIKQYVELWNDVPFVIDIFMSDYRYQPGELHIGNLLSSLFLFKLMSSYAYNNQLKIRFNIPTYILTSVLYSFMFLVIFISTFFVEPDNKFIIIYSAIIITYVWDYYLISRSDV